MTEPSLIAIARSLSPRRSTLFEGMGVVSLNAISAPLAILDGPPPAQGAWGWPALIVQTLTQVVSMPGTLADVAGAGVSNLLVPTGIGLPAARLLLSGHIGVPHVHLPPPAPPMIGLGVNLMVGAISVLAGGEPMLRTGDVGFAPTCLAPVYKILTGSATVFVGGKRAARLFDLTDHCPLGGSLLAAIEAPRTAARGATSLMDAMSIATLAVGVVAHGAAAVSDGESTTTPPDVATLQVVGEVSQAVLGVAQGIGDAALSAFHNLIGTPPALTPGTGIVVPTGLPGLVTVGGLLSPDLGSITSGHVNHWTRNLRALRIRALRRRREGRSWRCSIFGEPVDAVTGHVFGDHVDVDLDELVFARHYDSRGRDRVGDVGRGMRHTYERELEVWLHRCSYVDQDGVRIDFPAFRGRDRVSLDGYVIERFAGGRYEVTHRGETMVFAASAGVRAARLEAIRTERATKTIEHDGEGRFRGFRVGARGLFVERDREGHIACVRDERGIERAAFGYERGCLIASRNAEQREERFEYDELHRLSEWCDARGHRFVWRYDAESRCVHTSGQDRQWSCDFVYAKNETTVTHGTGLRETLHFDAYGVVLRVTRSDGGFLLREQDATGRIVRERDAAGRVVEWLYDETGEHISRRDRFGNELPPECDAGEAPSPLARELPTTLAPQLGLVAMGVAGVAATVPDSLATLASWALPSPTIDRAPQIEHDALGRVVRAVDARGRAVELRRDAVGNVIEASDRDRRATRALITGWNLVGSTIDALGRRIDATYTATEELASYREPGGSLTEYGRDAADRLVSITCDGQLRETYAYDTGDRLVEKRDAQGALVLRVSHHANALPRRIALSVGGTIELDYDRRGRVTRALLGEHDARIDRDESGTVLGDRCDGIGLRRWQLGAREVSTIVERLETRIDRTDDLVVVRDPTGRLTTFDLRAHGRVVRSLANGTREILAFDPEGHLEGRLAHRSASDGGLRSWAVRYERSGEGDLLGVWDSARGERRFEIDAAHRLEAEIDEQGRRHLYTHDAGDEVVASSYATSATFEHDARGRMSLRRGEAGSETHYEYDSLDQLVAARLRDGTHWRGSYDGLGRLRRFGRVGCETSLCWDGDRVAAELAHDGALRIHVYSDARALVPFAFVDYANIDAEPESGRAYFVFHDASGMPTQIEDASGRTVWWADRIDPYGAITLHPSAEIEYGLRWPGHLFDRDLGLHHNRFRAYDPTLARYLQPDPIGHAGSPHSLYAYATNPLVAVDLLGLTCDPRPIHGSEEATEGHPLAHLAARLEALAAEWGVHPGTGRFDPSRTLCGLSAAEVDRLARLAPRAGEPHSVFRRRRYLDRTAGGAQRPMPRWARDGFTANANREVSSPHERQAIESVGATYNNAPEDEGGRLEHTRAEYYDRNGRPLGPVYDPETDEVLTAPDDAVGTRELTTRPDGIVEHPDGGLDVFEHKHLRDGTTSLNDSEQLRAQRDMARLGGGRHTIILTSDKPLGPDGMPQVWPSAGASDGSAVLYLHTETGEMFSLDSDSGQWCRGGDTCE